MAMVVPTRAIQHAVGVVTAARDFDEPGGGHRLGELLDGADCQLNALALVVLGRWISGFVGPERIQELAIELADTPGPRAI